MGTDIEMLAEKRDGRGWKPCFPLRRNKVGDPCMTEVYRNDRNYVLFRILANVGRLTNHGIGPVFAPRVTLAAQQLRLERKFYPDEFLPSEISVLAALAAG